MGRHLRGAGGEWLLAAPELTTPGAVLDTSKVNGEWTSITLTYGPWDCPTGP